MADSLVAVLEEIDKQGIPRSEVAIEFLDSAPLDMIL